MGWDKRMGCGEWDAVNEMPGRVLPYLFCEYSSTETINAELNEITFMRLR